jgi:diguanylate cyclase (GGDEF)-like protein
MEKTIKLVHSPDDNSTVVNRLPACLVCIYPTGPGMGARYPLADKEVLLGRGSECTIPLDDAALSRRHARIEPRDEGYVVVDLDSTNGTFVNHRRVRSRPLNDGDYLRCGRHLFRFLAGGNVEAEYHEEIHRLAIFDALTEIPNKRYLLEYLDRELARTSRHRRPLALVLFDIDHFKKVNDERGHLAGDSVLRELANVLRPLVRHEELLARYGGEEFALVLHEANLEQARQAAERFRKAIADHSFTFDGKTISLTISLGVAATAGEGAMSPAELLQLADERLYEAKHAGRNCVAG